MLKTLFKVFLFLIPIFFVLGLIRFSVHNFEGDFIPTWSTWLGWFDNFPPIAQEWQSALEKFNELGKGGVCLIPGFEDAFGNSTCILQAPTNYIDGIAEIIWIVLSAPFRVISWFFVSFFS